MAANQLNPLTGLNNHNGSRLARSLYAGRVAAWLREAIIEGVLPASEPIIEMRLAETLQVSRGPIRVALQALAAEGLVDTLSNGRSVSGGFSTADADDLFRVRYELEATAITWAIDREADFNPLTVATDAIEADGPTGSAWVELDLNFHQALVEASGSRFLTQAWLAIAPVIAAVITVGSKRLTERGSFSNASRVTESHRALYEAVVARNTSEACRLLEEQFILTESMVLHEPLDESAGA